jgi:hypothetical protein
MVAASIFSMRLCDTWGAPVVAEYDVIGPVDDERGHAKRPQGNRLFRVGPQLLLGVILHSDAIATSWVRWQHAAATLRQWRHEKAGKINQNYRETREKIHRKQRNAIKKKSCYLYVHIGGQPVPACQRPKHGRVGDVSALSPVRRI